MNILNGNPKEALATLKREATAITLLHTHKDTIFDALEHSEDPLANFTAQELRAFLND